MEIRTEVQQDRTDILVTVCSGPRDARVPRVVQRLESLDERLVGYPADGSTGHRILPLDQVVFIETTEKRAFIHMKSGEELESPLRLFELEEKLKGTEFVRASRQVLLNFDYVVAIRPELNARLVLELEGGSKILVSRGYAKAIKEKLNSVR